MWKYIYLSFSFLFIAACAKVDEKGGHNGIRFDMTQKEVEEKGFVCNSPEKKQSHILAVCKHMDMTGVAFGYPTKDYNIVIGPSGKVDKIGAEFSNITSASDYLSLHSKIKDFFPNKQEAGSIHESFAMRDVWTAKNNSAAILNYTEGVPPFIKSSLSISFWSSRSASESSK